LHNIIEHISIFVTFFVLIGLP